jgi:hypothetical protein
MVAVYHCPRRRAGWRAVARYKAVFAQLKPLRDRLSADYRIEMQGAVESHEPDLDQ